MGRFEKCFKVGAVKAVNFIKSKSLESRLFEKLREEMRSFHKSLLLHTEVR